ncbi:putative mucin-associated surface protein (MASP) [Trypanosoma grayi]|uniref:putative mucin-associated surface protein (MASP) n=1 Tax=Trypanosoma grayi TaxID=71804 RepID=UPI0004F3F949|nr:putative mucin-associated surface protein (MASP) [Trypanosoma grayi]KEG14999.1 putative mucin-associated surface protein (MASP) [Trypanosoma grayi]
MRSVSSRSSHSHLRSSVPSAHNRQDPMSLESGCANSDVFLQRSCRRCHGENGLNEQRYQVGVVSARPLLSEEMRSLDAVEMGSTNPGSITLLKLLLPLQHANYPFNIHERHRSFIPGDAVALKIEGRCVKISLARIEDVYADKKFMAKKRIVSPHTRNSGMIGEFKCSDVQRITCGMLAGDTRLYAVRLRGAARLTAHLCFGERTLCSSFLKLLMANCHARPELIDEAGALTTPRHSVSVDVARRSTSACQSRQQSYSQSSNVLNYTVSGGEDSKTQTIL